MPAAAAPFPYRRPPEIGLGSPARAPVLIVGAGPVGLSAAIDLALQGVASIVCDDSDRVSTGSRAICWAKRTLEIFDRLGVGARMVAKGVTWKVGRLFHRACEVHAFNLLPQGGHKMPAFINLQQYYVEHFLVERCADFAGLIDLRWKNRVASVTQTPGVANARVETPDGGYDIQADYILACDGAGSSVRAGLGLDFSGQEFEERFLIADIAMHAAFPSERWFWFEPPFHDGESALLHKQPDGIYRIDLQLGPRADPALERQPERVTARIKAMLKERPFELDWVSVYAFQCRRLERFVHGRVIFAGDSAHVVSPFGARGGNGGIQDVDNLCWKLAATLRGDAGAGLLATYDEERGRAADENIRQSSRATRFMSPQGPRARAFRDAVLELAAQSPFARALVNSGRLSQPCSLTGLSLQTPAEGDGIAPGTPCPDAPQGDGWLLDTLGNRFALLAIGEAAVPECGLPVVHATSAEARARYGDATVSLIRPDQHVAARFRRPALKDIRAAHACALGHAGPDTARQ